MSSGEFGPTYTEVRNLNGLTSTEYADSVVDQHLKEASNEFQNSQEITIATTAQDFSNVVLDSRDFFFFKTKYGGTKSTLYFSDFTNLSTIGNILPILTITTVEARRDEDDTYETLTEGSDDDYTVDLLRNAIHFTHEDVSRGGYQNIRITGTYGVVASPLTDLDFKYKQAIALLAAIRGARYAGGSGFNEVKDMSAGSLSFSKSEYSATHKVSLDELNKQLIEHYNAYGLRRIKSRIQLIA